jgi:hypothetical protein
MPRHQPPGTARPVYLGLSPRCAAKRTNWRRSSRITTASVPRPANENARTGDPQRSPLTAAPGKLSVSMRQIACRLRFIVRGATHTSPRTNSSRRAQTQKRTIDGCRFTASSYTIPFWRALFAHKWILRTHKRTKTDWHRAARHTTPGSYPHPIHLSPSTTHPSHLGLAQIPPTSDPSPLTSDR